MRNVWKGFVIGSVVGAAVGIIVDSGSKASQRLAEAAAEADFGAKASELRERAANSEVMQHATDRVQQVARTGADALHQANDAASDMAANHLPS